MSFLNYHGKDTGTFQGADNRPMPVSMLQYILHYAYGVGEPTVMKISSTMLSKYESETSDVKKKILEKVLRTMENTSSTGIKLLPHGLVLSRHAAANVLDFVYYVEGYRGARLAVGPCICQLATKKYPENATKPEMKDIALYYGADIYTDIPLGHHEITADEAKQIVEEMHEKGNVHNVFYMFGKKSGAFVLCNCDRDVCVVVSATRVLGAGLNCEKGPEICKRDSSKCLGTEECGACAKRCPFGASKLVDGKIVFDRTKCMGCELCVTVCKGHARELEERTDYQFDNIMNRSLLLAGKYGRPKLEPILENEGIKEADEVQI